MKSEQYMKKIKEILSFSYQKEIGIYKFKINIWILLILLLSAFLNFYNLTNRGYTLWDEGGYLSTAKFVSDGKLQSLVYGFKFVHNAINALFFWLFGSYDYIGFASSAIFGVFTVYLVYLIGEKLFDERTGLFAATILAVTEYFIYFSKSAMSDGHLGFFVTLTMFVYLSGLFRENKANLVFTGVLAAACYATKNTGALVLVIIILLEGIFLISRKHDFKKTLKRGTIITFCFSALVIPLITILTLFFPGKSLVAYKVTGRIYDVLFLTGKGADFYFYSYGFLELSCLLTAALLILGVIRCIRKRETGDWTLLVWFIFLYTFLSAFPQHRVRLATIFLPAAALLAARGLTLFKKNKIIIPILALLIIFSLFGAYNTITMSSLGYKNAAEIIKQDGGKDIISTDAGKIEFYVLPYKVNLLGRYNNVSSLKEAYADGHTHIVLDWLGGRICPTLGWNKTKDFRDEILRKSEPIAIIENNNLYVDETHKLYWEMAKKLRPEEIEKYQQWQEMRVTNKYNDKYMRFTVYYYLNTDPYKDYIYVYRISDILRDLQV